ncbi:MAG: carboxypeptidase-like regulatory domain-containing protein, partial [Longimicrobiaceae bacterium]
MRRLLLAATLFPLALPVCAAPAAAQEQPGSLLVVRVLDEQGHPLMGARVTVGGVNREARSDGGGVARIERVPEGVRLVDVRREGYAYQRVASVFTPGDTVRREVVMKPDPIELEELTVTTWG